jgi:hypothetical protein
VDVYKVRKGKGREEEEKEEERSGGRKMEMKNYFNKVLFYNWRIFNFPETVNTNK